MARPVVQAGQRYGRLVVQSLEGRADNGARIWRCVCDCGEARNISAVLLTSSTRGVRSCG